MEISNFFYLLSFLPVLGYLLLPPSLPSLIMAILIGYGLILIGIAVEAITPKANKEEG